jgi:predicted metal-binding membrane protein
MKKNILAFLLLSLMIVPVLVSAQGLTGSTLNTGVDIEATLDNVRNLVFGAFLFFAAIMLIWAGFSFVTAGGDASKASAAREKVLYAIIGIVVAVASAGLIQFVKGLVENN